MYASISAIHLQGVCHALIVTGVGRGVNHECARTLKAIYNRGEEAELHELAC